MVGAPTQRSQPMPRPQQTSSLLREVPATQTIVLRATGRGQPSAVCVVARPLDHAVGEQSNLLFVDWDIGATSTVPFAPADPWSGPIAALSCVADGAAAMELDLVRCDNWDAVSVEFNSVQDGAEDTCLVLATRASMTAFCLSFRQPGSRREIALPFGSEVLDCASALSLVLAEMARQERGGP
jgi:hypothetical protein